MNWKKAFTEQGDTRRLGRRIMGTFKHSVPQSVIKVIIGLCGASVIGLLVDSEVISSSVSIDQNGVKMLWILIFVSSLWVMEALPAFSISLLAIALEIALLGQIGSTENQNGSTSWQTFIKPWSSPLIWLFLGGFVMAKAISNIGLDKITARIAISYFGKNTKLLLFGVMLVSFVLSMFMSNTATAAMMAALMTKILDSEDSESGLSKALLLGVAMASSLGGMGTIIGTPPNALAI